MKKIIWITSSNFLDHSFYIKDVSEYFNIIWYIVIDKKNFFTEEAIKKQISKSNIKLKIINLRKRLVSFNALVLFYKLLMRIRKSSYDIIYIDLLGIPYFWILVKLILPTKKVVRCTHDVETHYGIKNRRIIQIYLNFIHRNFKNFRLHSENQKKIFDQHFKNKNVVVAPLSIMDFGYTDVRPSERQITFLFFGSDRSNKGLNFLIEAGLILEKQFKNKFKIIIAGYSERLMKNKHYLENHSVFSIANRRIPNEEIPMFFLSSHYLVLPYIDITQSGPLHIAYNYNLPVIASDLEGFREFIEDNKTGYLFKAQDSKALASVMGKIIRTNNVNYPRIKSELSKYIEENLSGKSITEKLIKFFNTI